MALHDPDEDRARGLFARLKQGVMDTGRQVATGAGLLDRGMRFVGENPLDFHPLTGGAMALGDAAEAFQAGSPGMGLLAAAGVLPAVPRVKGVSRFAKAELDALRTRFTIPIKQALKRGDTVEANRLTHAMSEARPGGFQLPADNAARQARAAEQGFNTQAFHGTAKRSEYTQERLAAHLSGDEFNQFNWGTHSGTKKAANERLDAGRKSARFDELSEATTEAQKNTILARPLEGERIFPVKLKGEYAEMHDLGLDWSPSELMHELTKTAPKRQGIRDIPPIFTGRERAAVIEQVANGPRLTSFADGGQIDLTGMNDVLRERVVLNSVEGQAAVQQAIKDKGFAGIRYRNVVEDPGSTSFITFDPADIRSEFARFDPLNVAKPGLMGRATFPGVAAAGAGAAGLLSIIESRRNR